MAGAVAYDGDELLHNSGVQQVLGLQPIDGQNGTVTLSCMLTPNNDQSHFGMMLLSECVRRCFQAASFYEGSVEGGGRLQAGVRAVAWMSPYGNWASPAAQTRQGCMNVVTWTRAGSLKSS